MNFKKWMLMSQKSQTDFFSFRLAVIFTAAVLCSLFFFQFAFISASSLLHVSDTISSSWKDTLVDHTIRFTVFKAVPASGKIVITPQPNVFDILDSTTYTDLDVAVNGVDVTLAENAGSGAGSAWGVAVNSGKQGSITINLNNTDTISASSSVVVEIGRQAAYQFRGHKSIVNPLLVGSYKIHIETQNGSLNVLDRADAMVAILENVTAGVSRTLCGDGVQQSGEECDDGNTSNNDSCLNTCRLAACGDGYIRIGVEQCDDGNTNSGDGCGSSCQSEAPPPAPPPSGGGGGGGVPPIITKVILQGRAYPSSTITILIDGRVAAITKADSQANFKKEFFDFSEGVYTFGLWGIDKDGVKSVTFSFTTFIPSGKTTTISDIFLPPTIGLNKSSLPRGEVLKIFGQTAPANEVNIYINSSGEILNKTTADKIGVWLLNFDTKVLEEGAHNTRARAIAQEGLTSIFSYSLPFNVGPYPALKGVCWRADLNEDGRVNLVDFSILLYWWESKGSEIKHPKVDINQDGMVDLIDFSIMLYCWTG